MTARLVLVATPSVEAVSDAMAWARTPVRVVAATGGWVWVLPTGDGPVAMDRVVDEASDVAPALLVTVTRWRSELQLWRDEKPVRTLAWAAGTVSGLDPEDAGAAARDLMGLVAAPDREEERVARLRDLTRRLTGPRPGVGAWRDVVDLLGLPVPAGFTDLAPHELVPGQGQVVHTTGLLDAARTATAAERRASEALARTPRGVLRLRTTAVVAGGLGAWLSVSSGSWVPLLVAAAVVALTIALAGRIAP